MRAAILVAAIAVTVSCFPPPPCNDEYIAVRPGTYEPPADADAGESDWQLEIPADRDGGVIVETFTRDGKTYRITYRSQGVMWVPAYELPDE